MILISWFLKNKGRVFLFFYRIESGFGFFLFLISLQRIVVYYCDDTIIIVVSRPSTWMILLLVELLIVLNVRASLVLLFLMLIVLRGVELHFLISSDLK